MKALLAAFLMFFAMGAFGQDRKPIDPATDTSKASSAPAEKQCGGFAGIKCEPGFSCKYEADHPDAMGVCVKETKGRACGGKADAACPKGTKCKGAKGNKVCQ